MRDVNGKNATMRTLMFDEPGTKGTSVHNLKRLLSKLEIQAAKDDLSLRLIDIQNLMNKLAAAGGEPQDLLMSPSCLNAFKKAFHS